MNPLRSSRRHHIRRGVNPGTVFPDYGEALLGLVYDSLLLNIGGGQLVGCQLNANNVLGDNGGDKVFTMNIGTDLDQTNMVTAGNISTGVAFDSYILGGDNQDLHLQPDGSALFPVQNTSDILKKIPMSGAFNLLTAGATQAGDSLSTVIAALAANTAGGIALRNDGLKCYVNDQANTVHQASLTGAWDPATVVDDVVSYANGGTGIGRAIDFTPDGIYLMTITNNNFVRVHELGVPWSLGTAGFITQYDLATLSGGLIGNAYGIAIDVFRKKFYVCDHDDVDIYQFSWTG